MAITKSAKKAIRQSARKKIMNVSRKKTTKDLLKQFRTLVTQQKIDEAKKLLPEIYKTLDKSAKVGILKKNTASRKKSRLTKIVSKPSNK